MYGFWQKNILVVWGRISVAALVAVFILLAMPLLAAAEDAVEEVEEIEEVSEVRSVVINEVMWDGTEYIEIYNTTDTDIILDGWSLSRQQAEQEPKEIVSFDESDIIAAKTYFLIEKNEDATTVMANKLASGLTLVNTGEIVRLFNGTETVDQANWAGLWFAGENTEAGVSMERLETDSSGEEETSWYSSTGLVGGRMGTPGEINSVPRVNEPPEAFLGGPTSVLVDEELTLTAEDSSDPDGDDENLIFVWKIDGVEVSTQITFEHVFTKAGQYEVSVLVSDGEDEDTATAVVEVEAPVYTDDVVINELLPDPVGSDKDGEFIELYNTGGGVVDLSGWKIDGKEIPEGTEIGSLGWLVFEHDDLNFSSLVNSGDTVELKDPNGEVKDSLTYSKAKEGESYNRTEEGDYDWSITLTPGKKNEITKQSEEEEEDEDTEEEDEDDEDDGAGKTTTNKEGKVAGVSVKKVELKNVRREAKGAKVEVTGVVSVPPGVFGGKYIYLYGSGIQVYFSKEEWPEISLGDTVTLTGELSSIQGESRLKLAAAEDIKVVGEGGSPEPHAVKTGEVGEDWEGSLVTVVGSVSRTSGDTFYVDDGSGEVKVYIKPTTNIDKPKMKKGMVVTVTGVVSETSTGFRILPRWQEDVQVGAVAGIGMDNFPGAGRDISQLNAWLGAAQESASFMLMALLSVYLLWSAKKEKEPLLGKYRKQGRF